MSIYAIPLMRSLRSGWRSFECVNVVISATSAVAQYSITTPVDVGIILDPGITYPKPRANKTCSGIVSRGYPLQVHAQSCQEGLREPKILMRSGGRGSGRWYSYIACKACCDGVVVRCGPSRGSHPGCLKRNWYDFMEGQCNPRIKTHFHEQRFGGRGPSKYAWHCISTNTQRNGWGANGRLTLEHS